ncbi:MAG: diaminopimelate epimerase [Thermoguttaceae bacterium]|nr:diaminopimelate epimerase [Thermoguttaceae bacterium]MDW8077369.1 diaminopimelate epimerase [Thermoguttaceae bacterium]
MKFTKMHGAGNDYVVVNCFHYAPPADPATLARRMCKRHFGVGADGLILICPSQKADALMRIFNTDGSEAEMCGNGIRCVGKYVYDHGICRNNPLSIETKAGIKKLQLYLRNGKVGKVRVNMGIPELATSAIPTTLGVERSGRGVALNTPLQVSGVSLLVNCVSMGNPHTVIFVDELQDDQVRGLGPAIENAPVFPKRTNVEFVKVIAKNKVRVRVWERGCGETLACGTGAAAVCVAGFLTGRTDRNILVRMPGGALKVEWNTEDGCVYLTGRAKEVFCGEWPD